MPRIQPIAPDAINNEIKAAHHWHIETHGSRITNMKATMSKALPVFKAYMEWYPLYEEVKKITGERAAYLFAFAISSGSNCPLCTTYFRKIIIEKGENPDELNLSETEQLLLDFGSEIANYKGYVNEALYENISLKFSENEIISLVGFAGIMIATNIFNNTLEVEIDDYLAPFLPAEKS